MNSNLLALTGFKLKVNSTKDSKEFKNTEYFAVSASFPSISLPEVTTGFRNLQGFTPGDKLAYDPLTIRIAIDESLNSYNEIFDWLLYNTQNNILKTYDISLSFITNHNNISRVVRFANAFPTNLGGVEFSVQSTETEYAFADVTFRYDYFEFME